MTTSPPLGGYLLMPVLLALAALRDVWAPDEPRYAEVAREAWERGGSLLVLRLNGELYAAKPPLLYWLAGACGRLLGWSELAMRLPCLAATLGTAWLTGRLARRWLGEVEAAWAPALYLGTAMVLEMGGRLQIDPLLAFFCLAAIERLASQGVRSPIVSSDGTLGDLTPQTAAWTSAAAAGLCLGLGGLAKGPVAWLHVGIVLLAARALPRRLRLDFSRPAAHWALVGLLAVAPVALWALAAASAEPALWRPLFWGEHLGRAMEGRMHAGPPWDHAVDLLYFVLPWTPLFVWGLVRAGKALRAKTAESSGLVVAAAWFAWGLAIFSAIPVKRALYLLPVYPAIALVAAAALAVAIRERRLPAGVAWGGAGVLAGVGLGMSTVPWLVSGLVHELRVPIAATGAPLLAGGLLAGLAARRGAAAWARGQLATLAVAGLAGAIFLVPAINPLKSARGLALWVAARPERPTRIPCLGVQPEGYRFYSGLPTTRNEDLATALDREGDRFLAIVERSEYEKLPPELRERTTILERRPVGSREVLVLGGHSAFSSRTP